MSVEDIASQSSVVFETRYSAWLKKNTIISRVHVHVCPGGAETLGRRGGITTHYLIANSLSNISAKNYQNWLMYVVVIVCNISVVFWDTVYIFESCTCTSKMKFLGQAFQELDHKQDRHTHTQRDRPTDRRDRTHYQPHPRVVVTKGPVYGIRWIWLI